MTSHKEQPAVDTSARYRWNEPMGRTDISPVPGAICEASAADIIAFQKQTFPERNYTDEEALNDFVVVHWAWPLAAHPAEPAGMELETTAEERERLALIADYRTALPLVRDIDRLLRENAALAYSRDQWKTLYEAEKARAEKAEAALKQPVSDEEVEKLAQVLDLRADFFHRSVYLGGMTVSDELDIEEKELRPAVSMLRRLVRERDALSTQLRDAQARGKGMEGAPVMTGPELWEILFAIFEGDVPAALTDKRLAEIAAALSRPEGSAS